MSKSLELIEKVCQDMAYNTPDKRNVSLEEVQACDLKTLIVRLFSKYVGCTEDFIFMFLDECKKLTYQDWKDILRKIDTAFEGGRTFSMQAFLYVTYVWLGINMFGYYASIENGIDKKTRKYYLKLFGHSFGMLYRSKKDKELTVNDFGLTLEDLRQLTDQLVLQGAIPAIPIIMKVEGNQATCYLEGNSPKGWEWVKDYPVKKAK